MPTNNGDAFQQLALLAEDFRKELEVELTTMASQAALSDDSLQNDTFLKKLRDRAHRLAGSAFTFGYQQAGEKLQELEYLIDDQLGGNSIATDKVRSMLENFSAMHLPTAEPMVLTDNGKQPIHRFNDLIYVLEDDPSNGEFLKVKLMGFGYQVRWFQMAQEFIDACKQTAPDALIVDLELTGHISSGFDAVAEIRKALIKQIPLIIITQHASFTRQLEAAQHGAVGFFSKPVDLPALEYRLDYLLHQKDTNPYRVLLIDDDIHLLRKLKLQLEAVHIKVATSHLPHKIFDYLSEFDPDLIVLDVHMPHCSGQELAQIIRFHDSYLQVPIVYHSAERNPDRQLHAMMQAGDDFVSKSASDEQFVRLIEARVKRARQLSEQLSRDSLTGLLKHSEIKSRVAQELNRVRRNGAPLSIVLLDVDHFKGVNDTYGHTVGDVVLRTMSNFLRHRLRQTDYLGRYGGEEFLIVLLDCDVHSAVKLVDQLRDEFAQIPFLFQKQTFHCTFSAGVAHWHASHNLESFINDADAALYRAKDEGRNRVVVARSSRGE